MKIVISQEAESKGSIHGLYPAFFVEVLATNVLDYKDDPRTEFLYILHWKNGTVGLLITKNEDNIYVKDIILGDVYINTGIKTDILTKKI